MLRFNALLDIILPPVCLGCRSEGMYVCLECLNSIELYNLLVCPICRRRDGQGRIDEYCRKESGLTRFLGSPLPYSDEKVKKIIHSFKYNYAKEAALPLSQILIDFLDKNRFSEITKPKPEKIIVPVPLFHLRERERGFNQSEELAKNISSYYNIALVSKSLIKIKNTGPQAEIKDKGTRSKNVQGVFAVKNERLIRDKVVVLLDDVYTSGSTMRECSRVLRQSGAREVWGITLARGKI